MLQSHFDEEDLAVFPLKTAASEPDLIYIEAMVL